MLAASQTSELAKAVGIPKFCSAPPPMQSLVGPGAAGLPERELAIRAALHRGAPPCGRRPRGARARPPFFRLPCPSLPAACVALHIPSTQEPSPLFSRSPRAAQACTAGPAG